MRYVRYYKVKPSVPVPKPGLRMRYPFHMMEIGDKFSVKVRSDKTPRYTQKLILNQARRYAPKRFTTRKEYDGKSIGVWRTE